MPVTTNHDACEEIRLEWETIARTEVTRHRRRLGLLTPEQESAVESVLISIADSIFQKVMEGAESCSLEDRAKYLNVWRSEGAAA